eukprot:5158221-Pleurochrysis_carterae.AAC.1
MRTCGALALRSPSSAVPVVAFMADLACVRTSPPGTTLVGAPSPRARACAPRPLTIGIITNGPFPAQSPDGRSR